MTAQTISVELWSLNRAARELHVGAVTLRRWIAEQRLPEAYRDASTGAYYIPVEAVRRSIESGWAVRGLPRED